MSDTGIFVVGLVIFTLTVWGTVMAGGLALTKNEIEENSDRGNKVDKSELDKRMPRIEY
jgi:hypothetical protein